MPKKRIKKFNKNNLKIGIIFFAVIFLLLAFSFIGKIFSVVKMDRFDENFPFVLSIEEKNGVNQFACIYPKQHQISILDVNKASSSSYFAIKDDARVFSDSLRIDSLNSSSFFIKLLKNEKNLKTNLTVIDVVRLAILSKAIEAGNVRSQKIDAGLEEAQKNKIISSLCLDSDIVSEGLRIEVVNATGVYGVGNRVAQIISNIGGNVVFVSTADNEMEKSVIYYGDDKTYTLKRLSRVLGFTVIKSNTKSISDIKVQVGKDSNF